MPFFMSLLFLTSTLAARAQDFTWGQHSGVCMTAVMPSTTFSFDTGGLSPEEQKVSVVVQHHNGLQFAPFWDALVVPQDLDLLKKKSDVITQLKPEMSVSWKASKCQWFGDGKVYCVGSTDAQVINGKKVVPFAFHSSKVFDSSFAGDYTYYVLTLVFYIDDEKYAYSMKYQDNECDFQSLVKMPK